MSRARSSWRDRVEALLARHGDHLAMIIFAVIVLIGIVLRVYPALSARIGPASELAWKAVYLVKSGGFEPGSEGLVALIGAVLAPLMGAETAVSLAPVIIYVVGAYSAFSFAYILTRSTLAGLVSSSLIAVAPTLVAATSAGTVVEDTSSVMLLPLTALLLASILRNDGNRSLLLAAVLGVTIGLSQIFWARAYLAPLMLLVFTPIAAVRGKLREAAAASIMASLFSAAAGLAGAQWSWLSLILSAWPAAAAAAGTASRLLALPQLQAWLSFMALAFTGFALLSGSVQPPPELSLVLGLPSMNLEEAVVRNITLGVNVFAALREAGVWLALTLLAYALLVVKWLQGRLETGDAVLLAITPPLLAAVLLGYASAAYVIPAMTLLALSSSLALWSLEALGLKPTLKDDLSASIYLAVIIFLAIQIAYDVNASIVTAPARAPQEASGFGALYLLGGDAETTVSDAWQRLLQTIPKDALVVAWGNTAYLLAAKGYRVLGYTEGSLDLAARILTANEDEATALLRDAGYTPADNIYVVVHELMLGVYDLQQNAVILYPAPAVTQIQQANIYFVVHGRIDMGRFFEMLKVGDRIPDDVTSPFDTDYATEYINQGVRVFHFPGLIGQPAENLRKSREALVNRLLIDGVFKLGGDEAQRGAGCDFLAETAVYVPAVYTQSQLGGMVQPLFILADTARFEPVASIMSCPSVTDTGERIEFAAEVIVVYHWTG